MNRLVLRQEDVVEQGGYQKQEPFNCEFESMINIFHRSTDLLTSYQIRHYLIIHHFISLFFPYSIDISTVKKSCDNFNVIHLILNLIPVLKWLPKYSIKHDLAGDISSGITVAVMHIPQGMIHTHAHRTHSFNVSTQNVNQTKSVN